MPFMNRDETLGRLTGRIDRAYREIPSPSARDLVTYASEITGRSFVDPDDAAERLNSWMVAGGPSLFDVARWLLDEQDRQGAEALETASQRMRDQIDADRRSAERRHDAQIRRHPSAVFHSVDAAGMGSGDSMVTSVNWWNREDSGMVDIQTAVSVHNDHDLDGNYVQHWDAETLREAAASLLSAADIMEKAEAINAAMVDVDALRRRLLDSIRYADSGKRNA